ncbi:MAG: GGDEF domain-containing protein [bacterium]
MNNLKNNLIWIVLTLVMLISLILNIIISLEITSLSSASETLTDIEYLNSSTQRIVKLSIEDRDISLLLKDINKAIISMEGDENIKNTIADAKKYNQEISVQLDEVLLDWSDIQNIVTENVIKKDLLYFSGERHFYNSNELSQSLSYFIERKTFEIKKMEIFMIIINIIIILLIIKAFEIVQVEMKKSKKLASNMFVDSATGLYDRSKCQELFKEEALLDGADEDGTIIDINLINRNHGRSKIVIVFDLNDLKKTNDTYGHKIGDELIETFARILREGAKIHKKEPFLGRYGGDEFVVYYESAKVSDVETYLKEVNQIREEQNKKESRYQVSYAVGYAVADKNSNINTFRELFDTADKNMYENKKMLKAKQV